MTARFFRGDGPGHDTGHPPTIEELHGNGYAVGEFINGKLDYRTSAQMETEGGANWSRLVTVLPQAMIDMFDWRGIAQPPGPLDPPPVVVPPPPVEPPPPSTVTSWADWTPRTDYGGHDHGAGTSSATVDGDILTLTVNQVAGGDRRVSVDHPDGKLGTRFEVEFMYPELPPPGSTQATSIYINRSGDDSDFQGGYGPHGFSISAQPDRNKLVLGRRSGFSAHDGLEPYDEQSGSVPFTFKKGVWYHAAIQRDLPGGPNWVRMWVGETAQPMNRDGSPKEWTIQAPATWVDQPGSVQLWNHDGPNAPARTTKVQFRNPKIMAPITGPATPPVVTPPPPPPPTGRKFFGLMGMTDQSDIDDLAYMHFNSSRVEISVYNDGSVSGGTGNLPYSTVDLVNGLAAKSLVLHPLFNNYDPLPADGAGRWASGVVEWVQRYGRGGTFWQGRTDFGPEWGEAFNEFWGTWWNRGDNNGAGMYTQYVIATRKALNTAGLQAFKILHSSPGNGFRNFDNEFIAAGGLTYVDGISIHPYDNDLPAGQGWRAQVDYALSKFPGKPVMCTEHGYTVDVTQRRQWVPQQIAEVIANPRLVGIQFFEMHPGNAAWQWKGDRGLYDAARAAMVAGGY